ncbi:MAG: RidA family protein [Pseudomonadota bacterium]
MTGKIERRLEEMGIVLPEPLAPVADYVPFVQTGNLVFVSGQIPKVGDDILTGHLTSDDHAVDGTTPPGSQFDKAVGAATLCAVNILSQVKACVGDLDRVTRVVKLTGFVNCDHTFIQQPQIINGASGLMLGVFGDAGLHSRAAVGSSSLPLGVLVEVEGVFEVA